MYVYKEVDLNEAQYEIANKHRKTIEEIAGSGSAANIDHVWLKDCSVIHRQIFGGPTPNIKSNGLPIVSMFKNLLRKLKEYEDRTSTIRKPIIASSSVDERPHKEGEKRKHDHFRRR